MVRRPAPGMRESAAMRAAEARVRRLREELERAEQVRGGGSSG